MASPRAWEAHTSSHAFFPIHTKEEFLHFCLVKDGRQRRQRVHNNITCDGCKQKNIVGVRHKCLQCEGKGFVVPAFYGVTLIFFLSRLRPVRGVCESRKYTPAARCCPRFLPN